jgi:hypothetical protein
VSLRRDRIALLAEASARGFGDLAARTQADHRMRVLRAHRRRGRLALAAAVAGVFLFVGSWFVSDPWPGTTNYIVEGAMIIGAAGGGVAAILLGAWGWRSASGKAAVMLVGCVVGLYVLAALTLTFD